MIKFCFVSRDENEFEETKILNVSDHPVSAVCVLPSSDGEQLQLIAVACSRDNVTRIYRIGDANPLYQLEGHTDTGGATPVVFLFFIICSDSLDFVLS